MFSAKKSKNYDHIQNQELGLPGRVFYIKSRKLKEVSYNLLNRIFAFSIILHFKRGLCVL